MFDWLAGHAPAPPRDYLLMAWCLSFPAYRICDVLDESTDHIFTFIEYAKVEGIHKKQWRIANH